MDPIKLLETTEQIVDFYLNLEKGKFLQNIQTMKLDPYGITEIKNTINNLEYDRYIQDYISFVDKMKEQMRHIKKKKIRDCAEKVLPAYLELLSNAKKAKILGYNFFILKSD